MDLEDFEIVAPPEQLIGTEECSYCHLLTECLSLPNDGNTERAACRYCVVRAFDEICVVTSDCVHRWSEASNGTFCDFCGKPQRAFALRPIRLTLRQLYAVIDLTKSTTVLIDLSEMAGDLLQVQIDTQSPIILDDDGRIKQ
jgi:hypothetical protein